MKKIICLGIESTAHTFGVSVVTSEEEILSNEKILFTTKKGGMIPAKVADFHVKNFHKVIKLAIEKSGKSIADINLVAFSQSPGMGHSLKIGAMVAKSLSLRYKIPLVGVNHCIAHLEIGRILTKAKDPVMLYASGANTQIIAYEGKKYRIFGETLDIGVGNFIDSFARELGLGFPGGPKIYELSLKGKNYIELPYSVKGMDVSFGGLLTNLKQKIKSGKYNINDLCYSVQETIFAMLVEVSERAMAHCGKKELLLGGGVGCNIRLQEMCRKMCESRGAKFYSIPNQYLVDNPAMIAWLGILQYNAGNKLSVEKVDINPYERTDDIKVIWRKD